jgi:hypothetical protein
MTIIGEQVNNFLAEGLSMRPRGAMEGGVDPFPGMRETDSPLDQLSGFGRSRGQRPEMGTPSLGHRRAPRNPYGARRR